MWATVIGFTFVKNAFWRSRGVFNAAGGSIRVEALDPECKVIEGFAKKDCTAITSDSVRHVLKWKPLRKNLWVDSGQIVEFVLFLQFFASFRAFEIWRSDS